MSVERVLRSPAFELVSLFSKEAQEKIDRYFTLRKKPHRTPAEEQQLQMVMPFIKQTLGEPPPKSELENKMDKYLGKLLE